ncbi:glycosyltransferase family protein [Melioribacter sp. Ez-97]|uniref:glycosyltransferase family protein n=1 Tax=Melioribacter sp. Ez-97 TaxID=3423434 RepID=UPI003ED937FF
MKIAFPNNSFPGGFLKSIEKVFINLGYKTFTTKKFSAPIINRIARKAKFPYIYEKAVYNKIIYFNNDFIEQILDFKPDIFFNYSGSGLFPETVKKIKEETKCLMICFVADNPCDPDPRRDQFFPMTLQYYDIFLNPEPVWDKIIYNLCKNPKIIRFYGGYDPEKFYPIDISSISEDEKKELECQVSFTGGSYYKSAEGAYRAGILGQLEGYNVKIWGDEGWKYRFHFYPKIKEAYQGPRLSYDKLCKLYTLSMINLNIPSPQIFTSFQPRVFDIAATKGFQIIDFSPKLLEVFDNINIVTFKNINELKEKINYYTKNERDRDSIIEEMYCRVKDEFTWENQVKFALKQF